MKQIDRYSIKCAISQLKAISSKLIKSWINRPRSSSGFTLIEIMVVIVILGILVGYVAVRIMDKPEEARQLKARMDIASIETALKIYKLDNGTYPTTEQGLQALVEAPTVGRLPMKWRKGGYLEKTRIPKDPWDNDYIFLSPGLHGDFDLMSYGHDGEPGGEGKDADINSWELD
ncbi:MAG: type II secretion system major pseudopilin GspG [Deltaproteobacteria bacterium]|nr:type II secretion system major pseudopilin GspG [Deltaproteobacteria bacterium]